MLYTENNTDFACYIVHIHQPILIIFGRNSYGACTIISLFNFSCPFSITSLIGCEIAKAETTPFQRHCLLVNMPFTKDDKILIKNLFELKGYNARHLVRDFPRKSYNVSSVYKLLQSLWVTGWSTVVPAVQMTRRPH